MSDIREWLEGLGLGQYADSFEHNDIGLDVVATLSEADLTDLGVSLGNRRRLLKAIAETAGGRQTSQAAKAAAPEAERRQITVMFCDLVGSTALSERLDPEDLRDLMAAYQKACAGVVERYQGHVAQYLGDGIMVYFGWPRAHEDDAQRAVRTGLEIIEAVGAIEAPVDLPVRIGVETGPVVVGETGGGDPSVAKTAVGETPNLAARIQALAEADAVLIGPRTRRLVAGAFDLQSLGAQTLKGISETIEVFRVHREAATESRFEARAAGGLTPFIGRDAEITMLLERWRHATEGDGQVVLLEGEPGIGKSRITQVLSDQAAGVPHTRLRYQCSPYYVNTAFYPFIEQIERAARFDREDTVDTKLDKLEAVIAQSTGDVASSAPLIAAMLSLPADRYPSLDVDPTAQKELTVAALVDLMAGLAQNTPILLIFEDVHWVDPTSLEVLALTIDRIQHLAALLLLTYRPEFEPPWSGHGHITSLSLNRLSRRQGADMVARVTGGKSLPDEVLDQIVAKTDGVPLFVEELTKTVVEAGFLKEESDRYVLDGPLPALAIPTTLQDSLMARLDRLSPVKEVAQIGACIGREFSYGLLSAVSPLRDNELADSLSQLMASELIFARGTPPDAVYTFKHALVQDAAYESLLKSRRAQLHAKLADAFLKDFPDIAAAEPETVARHLTEAGQPVKAIEYWEKAGASASQRSSNVEAIGHLETALSLVPQLPESAEPVEQELRLLNILAAPLMNTKGYAAPETGKVYERIAALCKGDTEGNRIYQALAGLSTYHMVVGDIDKGMPIAEEMLALAEQNEEKDAIVEANRLTALFAYLQGQFERSVAHLDIVQSLFDPDRRQELALTYGQDHEVSSYVWQSMSLAPLGYLDRCRACIETAIEISQKGDHAYTQTYAYAQPIIPLFHMRDFERLDAAAERTIALCTEHSVGFFLPYGAMAQGYSMVGRGDVGTGLARLQEGVDQYYATGTGALVPQARTMLAEALIARGDLDEARGLLGQATEQIERWGETYHLAEVNRVRGDWHRLSGDNEAAETCYREAVTVAQGQEAKLFELRAATALAKLWHDAGKAVEAKDLLMPVFDWFTEGFDLPDLTEAKALLEQLSE